MAYSRPTADWPPTRRCITSLSWPQLIEINQSAHWRLTHHSETWECNSLTEPKSESRQKCHVIYIEWRQAWDYPLVRICLQTQITNIIKVSHYIREWVSRGLTSHSTLYRSFRGRFFTGQMTQPTASKHWRKPVGGLSYDEPKANTLHPLVWKCHERVNNNNIATRILLHQGNDNSGSISLLWKFVNSVKFLQIQLS